jgi:hypothetical protein
MFWSIVKRTSFEAYFSTMVANSLACVVLKSPKSTFRKTPKYIEPIKANADQFKLKMPVGDIAPIGRFIFGLISRIKILGDQKFKTELNNYYKQYVEDGLSEIKKQWD